MASNIVVPVTKIQNVRAHPNADRLEIADVLGFQVCIPKGHYHSDELIVFFPPDILIPKEWAEKFGITKILKGQYQDRVGKVKLRGELSFGVVTKCENPEWKEGDNLAEYFGVKKYIPPTRTDVTAAPYDDKIDPFIFNYTDIQNGRIFTNVFEEGEEVIVTEKIHGSNCKLGYVKDQPFAGSMELRRIDPGEGKRESSDYWYPWTLPAVVKTLECLRREFPDATTVQLFGEVYGTRVFGKYHYGVPSNQGCGFRAFDILVDGQYLGWERFTGTDIFGLEIVPVIYRGPFSQPKMLELANGPSQIGNHIREGIVVRSLSERSHPETHRAVLKYISTQFDMDADKVDYKDV